MSVLRLLLPAVAVVALSVLGACGEDTGQPAEERSVESPSAFDAATATLSDQPFCETVDITLVAGALGMPADQVELLEDSGVDEELPSTRRVNSCAFGSTAKRLVMTVQPRGAEAAVERRIDEYRNDERSCQVADDSWFGSPGVVADCEGGGAPREVAVTGLVGSSGFFCSAVVDAGVGPELHDATVEVCRDTLETLGIPD